MSLERFVKPRSIAVFGGYQAQEVIRQSDRMGYDGEIWPVHPKKDEILGRKVFRSVADLPGSPDAAYVGVNRNLTIDIVRDLAARNAGGAICYATGFTEAGEEGSELEKQLLEASGDMPLVGPNCYGILNYLDGAMLWPDQQGGRRVEEGVADHHGVLQRGLQPLDATPRSADRLHDVPGQPAEVQARGRDAHVCARGAGHGPGALPRGDVRPEGLRRGGQRRPGSGQADRCRSRPAVPMSLRRSSCPTRLPWPAPTPW